MVFIDNLYTILVITPVNHGYGFKI